MSECVLEFSPQSELVVNEVIERIMFFECVCVLCFREVLKYYPVVQIFYIYTPVFLYMNNVLWLLLLLFDTK